MENHFERIAKVKPFIGQHNWKKISFLSCSRIIEKKKNSLTQKGLIKVWTNRQVNCF